MYIDLNKAGESDNLSMIGRNRQFDQELGSRKMCREDDALGLGDGMIASTAAGCREVEDMPEEGAGKGSLRKEEIKKRGCKFTKEECSGVSVVKMLKGYVSSLDLELSAFFFC